jgi:phenylacetate-coenzyme A ligase PaaK-like adenylate-forming protein
VTNLSLGKSVYIRFDTEDVAEVVPGDCPCGRTHPVVEFYGRLADSVVLPGRIITPADVRGVLDEFERTRFRPFSMTWKEAGGLLVRLGGGAETRPAERSKLEEELSTRLSVPVSVSAGEVERAGWKEERITRNTEG